MAEIPLSLSNLFSITGTVSSTVVIIAVCTSYPRRTLISISFLVCIDVLITLS